MNEHACTYHARFHLQIVNSLRRTSMTSPRELALLGEEGLEPQNPVFFLNFLKWQTRMRLEALFSERTCVDLWV